jgi:hypothetical protein
MSPKLRTGLLIALGGVLLLSAAAYVFRDPLATKLTATMLDRSRDMQCTHPDIRISSTLQRITVSPLQCEMLKPGPLKAFESHSEAVLTLEGLTPSRVYVSRATMDQREREVKNVDSNTLGDLANVVGIRDMLVKGMLDASESFSPGGPIFEADTIIAKRGGKVDSIMKHFRRSYEDGWDHQHAERMESPGGGSGPVAMRDFDMRATRSEAKLRLALYIGKSKPGEEPDIALKIDATGLDDKTPRVNMSL